jgi:hypothetical protein
LCRRADELGANRNTARWPAGIYTGRVLEGEKPADLPVMRAAQF